MGENFNICPLLIKTNGVPYRGCFLENKSNKNVEDLLSSCNILIFIRRINFYTSILENKINLFYAQISKLTKC